MNESIRKFLSFRISARSLEDFTRNTATVTSFIVELESLEAELASFDGLNKDKYSQLNNKYSALKSKYDSLKEFFTKNQEISGRLGVIEAELERYNKVIDFGSLLGELKSKVDSLSDIDSIIRDYNSLKTIYDKSSEIINKNERVKDEYITLSEKVDFIIANKECLNDIIRDINSVSVTDDNYESLLEKFNAHKEKLEELNDVVLLPRVNDILEILSLYPEELAKAIELQNKIQFIINRISIDTWSKRGYLTELKRIKTGFVTDLGLITLTKHSFISSVACQNCLASINKLQEEIDKVDDAIKKSRKIYEILDEIGTLTDVSIIESKINDAKDKYKKFKHKERFPNLETDIKDVEKNSKKAIQNAAVNAIKNIESKVFASNASSLRETTLRGYKKTVNDDFALLDSEHKSKIKYAQIIARIDSLLKSIRRKDLHDSSEWYYLPIVLICTAFIVGYYFYTHYAGYGPVKWLFNNPPFFAHKWQHWGLKPWKWVESITVKELLSFLLMVVTFVGAVICMLFCLIGEVLWFLITLIAFGISWLAFTILSILLHLLMYGFPAVIGIIGIVCVATVKSENTIKSPTWMIISIVFIVALVAVAYLNFFKVLVF